MMRNHNPLKSIAVMGIFFLTISCTVTPELVEPAPAASSTLNRSVGALPSFPTYLTLDRVKIFTQSGTSVIGTVTVEIANTDGSVIDSAVLPGSSFIGSKWTTFYFSPITLVAGKKYRIQVKRSVANTTHDSLHWGATSGVVDAYPEGETSISGVHPPYDMAFITYSGGYVDQQQTTYQYYWGIGTQARWQEFVPEKIWVTLP